MQKFADFFGAEGLQGKVLELSAVLSELTTLGR